jgi:diacylglycerol O-acyltransferase / wax synthase
MKSLSGLDATFLYLETPETPMHVGSLNLYELPKGFKGSFHQAVRRHIAKRMHLAPIFSRRLAFMPFELGHPTWVEDRQVDLDFHIRKLPGKQLTIRQAETATAKLHSQLIDRRHPLWEFHVFDDIKAPAGMGIEGRLVGLYSKIHHAALDGKAGVVLSNAILDLSATPREMVAPELSRNRSTGTDLKVSEMIGAVFSNSLAQYAKLARSLPAVAGSLGAIARQSIAGRGKGIGGLRANVPITLAPGTIFNVGITRERVFATASLPFAQCKAMAKVAGGTFNDVVLWICSTALRNYLTKHASLPKKPLIAAMPVSLRDEHNTEMNTQASIMQVELGTHLADPFKRMKAIIASTAKVKQALVNLKSVLPTDYPSLLSPWLVGGMGKALYKAYGKGSIAGTLPSVANVAISNVPGPQVPLYLAGARMLTYHPLSIVLHGLALNITVQTYAGAVDFGLVADKRAVPHLHDLANALTAAFQEAKGLFVVPADEPIPAPKTTSRPRRKAAVVKAEPKAPRRAASRATP